MLSKRAPARQRKTVGVCGVCVWVGGTCSLNSVEVKETESGNMGWSQEVQGSVTHRDTLQGMFSEARSPNLLEESRVLGGNPHGSGRMGVKPSVLQM